MSSSLGPFIYYVSTCRGEGGPKILKMCLRNIWMVPKLEDIMMRYPSNLKALYLDHNRLQTFHRETFSGQTSMDVLSISDNKLDRIPSGVFVELINLFRLSLANNRIAIIEDNALTGLHRVSTVFHFFSKVVLVLTQPCADSCVAIPRGQLTQPCWKPQK